MVKTNNDSSNLKYKSQFTVKLC